MIVAANWKMNPELSVAATLASDYCATLHAGVTRILFAPHPYLVPIGVRLQGSGILLGGQDCHQSASGAHTGDVSTAMLCDCGASLVLLGHSERRADHGETSELVAAKAVQAFETGLSVMICVGETLAEREAGNALATVLDQLAISVPATLPTTALTIAYEPVWAIGTGKVATAVEIAEMHLGIRRWLDEAGFAQTEILYGGSVKPGNAAEIFAVPHVDGALVGGASLVAADFAGICAAAAG
jgi:triosephosphate isomerase